MEGEESMFRSPCISKPNSRTALLFTLLILVSLSVVGCATVGTQINDPKFKSENQPVRDVKVIVANDGTFEKQQIEALLAKVSGSLEEQVGVRLTVTRHVDIHWGQRDPIPMLETLYERTQNEDGDLVVGFGSKSSFDMVKTTLIGGWQAVIDDTYRRYVVMTNLDAHNLTHEICHAFIFSHCHSNSGLMQAMTVELVPGVPIFRTEYLSAQDRREVLKNKWRRFNEIQDIADSEREHTVNLTNLVPMNLAKQSQN